MNVILSHRSPRPGVPEALFERRDLGQIETETETEPRDSARPGTTEPMTSAVRTGSQT